MRKKTDRSYQRIYMRVHIECKGQGEIINRINYDVSDFVSFSWNKKNNKY
jgi:hypothetical protein